MKLEKVLGEILRMAIREIEESSESISQEWPDDVKESLIGELKKLERNYGLEEE